MTNKAPSVDTPAAFFITWSCYGTHLHGDERGSVDRTHNVPETPLLSTDAARTARERTRLTAPPVNLSPPARRLVDTVIREHCAHRGWDLLAVNVRSTHVHVVVAYPGAPPETVLSQLKAWAARRLREAGLADGPIWTRGGSTRYVWQPASVNAVVSYVMDGQDGRR